MWHSSHHRTRRATLRWCAAAGGSCALLLGAGGACIKPGPLFSDDVVAVDAGAEPASEGLGRGGSAGAVGATQPVPSAPSSIEGPPLDAGLNPAEGPPLPSGPIAAAPGCDGGSPAGCEGPPDEQSPAPEDPCIECLANICPADVERCDNTDGCDAIITCSRRSGCELDDCYCGTVDEFLCLTTGQADGPCRDVTLAAPGAHPPSLVDPIAGPAAEAARAVGSCRLESDGCRAVCDG